MERREEERRRAREEQRRQEALERQQEEERRLQREEERRQEALRQAREFEAALEAARLQREALLERVRNQRRAERRETLRQRSRQAALLEVLREANRRERREAADEAQRSEAARQTRLDEQRTAEQAEIRLAEARSGRREEDQARQRESGRREESRQQRLEDRREEQRRAERDDERRAEARQGRLEEQREAEREAQRETERDDERRSVARRDRLEERREEDRARRQEAERREEASQQRLEEQREVEQRAERNEERRAEARQARLDERGEAEREAASESERRSAARERQASRQASPRDPLQDNIASGVLSGALPWLRATGSRIATPGGEPVVLRGVNLLGLDAAGPHPERGFAAGAGISEATVDAALGWGGNVIRLAINRDRVLNGYGRFGPWEYLADLDRVIERAASRGAYTLLSLRRLDDFTVFGTRPGPDGAESLNFIAPQPDYDTIGMWRILGERYADEPAVLFDLFTSPHAALGDDLTGFDTDWPLWSFWVRLMVADLRRVHPRALCFVSGLDWATDLSGLPVIGTGGRPIPNLVYAAHLTPRQGGLKPPALALARKHPLFVSEWGGGPADTAWGERMARTFRAEGFGWTAAHWNAEPLLARTVGGRVLPTPFGAVVRRALAMPDERVEEMAPGREPLPVVP